MSADDNNNNDIPAPDDPESTGERAKAESFAEMVDLMVSGDDLPAVLAQDQRALLEVATLVRSASIEVPLHADRRDALIESALTQAIEGSPSARTVGDSDPAGSPVSAPGITPLRPRNRVLQAIPWAVSAIAAAAAIFLYISRPTDRATTAPPVAAAVEVDTTHQSRPTDALVGEITRDKAEAASSRIDVIYADRMNGFRDMTLRGKRSSGGTR
jgi:hypothetical protein